MTVNEACVYCKHCYLVDELHLCYAIKKRGPDCIEDAWADLRQCKRYKSRGVSSGQPEV